MNAAELRSMAEALHWHETQTFAPQHKEIFAAAAEVLELLAWAEERQIDVQRGKYFWWSRSVEDGHSGDKTLIGLLRRAREASKS